MGLWGHLLSTPEGQFSLVVIALLVGMGLWFAWYFNKKIIINSLVLFISNNV